LKRTAVCTRKESRLNLLMGIDIQGKDATMTISKEQVLQRAIEMSNKKPRVQVSREVLEHIDPSKRVRVYRNLHKQCFSVQQDGLVRCHTDHVTLQDCKFIVSKAGQKRVRDEGRKNVHAFVEGLLVDTREADAIVDGTKSDAEMDAGNSDWKKAYYNPYTCDTFINQYDGSPLETATFADLYVDPTTINIFC